MGKEILREYRRSAGRFLRESRFAGAGWGLGALGAVVGIVLRGLRSVGVQVTPMIPELVIGVSFVTVFVASVYAYHKLRLSRDLDWDEGALRITENTAVELPGSEKAGSHMVRLVVFAKKSLPQPNRIRIWFNCEPQSYRIECRVALNRGARHRPPILLTPDNSTVGIAGSLLDISYLSPPLDDPDQYLAVWAWAPQVIRAVRSAGYRTGE